MNSRAVFFAAIMVAGQGPVARAQEGGERNRPVTQAQALKLGPEELTQFTDPSEVGQDRAAHLYATAKRIETEQALARKNVRLVIDLDEWRVAISKCRRGAYALAYVINGGGTMYTHGRARDGAAVEDFLAGLARRLPPPEGKGDPRASKQIDETLAFLAKLKAFERGDAKEDKRARAELAAEVKRVSENWTSLRYMIDQIPAEDARKIVEFTAGSLDWLKGEDGK